MNTITSKERADCAVVSIARATGKSYEEAYRALADCGRKSSQRTYGYILEKALKKLGFKVKYDSPESVTMRTVHNHCPIGVPAVVYCTGHFATWDGHALVDDHTTSTRRKVRAIYSIKEPS